MRKKVLLVVLMLMLFCVLFAISVSAETPEMYIEFAARFPGSDEYITVYTQNAETTGNPQINFASYKFYSDVEFTQEVDMSTATGIDFSVTKSYVNGVQGNAPTRMKKPNDPFVNCVEVKWFLSGFPTVSYEGAFFKGWTGLKTFDFGNATAIADNTFEGCGLESITIPASITSIGGSAFMNCLSLKSVKIEGTIAKYNNGQTFYGCSALEAVDLGPNTTVGKSMFYNCTALKNVNLSNITKIETQAFYNCTQLAEVNISNVTSMGKNAFAKSGIVSVIIPNSLTSFGDEVFANCKSLTTVVFEEGYSGSIGGSAFMGTSSLTTLTLVEGITKIPSQCFWTAGSSGVIEKVTLPDSVESLAGRAFNGATIKVLEIRETSNLKKITGDAFAGMKYLESIYLPTGVEISCENLFQYCHKLQRVENFENVKFNVSSYGEDVFTSKTFYECMALKEIKIPNGVTAIAGTAWRLYDLERVYIPASVTSINSGWLSDTTHMPSSVTFFYCGGDASKLLSLTDDGTGAVSARFSQAIENNNIVEYIGLNASYNAGAIVYNVNTCDVYYGGIHLDSENVIYTYIDEKGNETQVAYINPLKVSCLCGRGCGVEKTVKTIPALFVCLGYSAPEDGRGGIAIGYTINNEAIAEYVASTGKTFTYGAFAVAQQRIGNGDVFGNDGTTADGVIAAELSGYSISAFELKILGFTDEYKDAKLALGAYVAVTDGETTEYSYLQSGTPNEGEKYCFTSYNEIVGVSSGNEVA